MDFFFNSLRKFLTGVTALIFTFVVIYVPQQYNDVPKAQAQIGVVVLGGIGSISEVAIAANTAIASGMLVAGEARESILDAIAYHIAKAFIAQIIQSTITWINNGFKGSPAFIQDLGGFLLNVADEAAGEFIKELGEIGSFICSPFRLDIQLALTLEYQRANPKNREEICKLSDIVDNVEDFYRGEIARDNFWEQWIEVTSSPTDWTPYGQLIEARADMELRIINSKGQVLEETKWGSGFLSSKVCETVESPNGPKEKCVISTPGQTIASSLNKALGASTDQLVAADEINELIGALIGQIANQALTGAAGLLGLSVAGSSGNGSGESYVDAAVRESNTLTGSYIERGIADIEEKLAVQIDYRDVANEFIPQLRRRSLDPLTESKNRAQAEVGLADAEMIRDITTGHIAKLQPLVTRYRALETEYNNPATAVERKKTIRTEQSSIISQGIQYRVYTKERLRASEREWSDILRQ